jgi:hypothetical protein
MIGVGLRKTSFAIFWFIVFWLLGLVAISIFLNATNTSNNSSENSYQTSYQKGQEAGKKIRIPLTIITGLLAVTGIVAGVLPGTSTNNRKNVEIESEPNSEEEISNLEDEQKQ